MTSKAEYLRRYVEGTKGKKTKRRVKKKANLAVHDDDVDWRSLAPASKKNNVHDVECDSPEEAPLIAEFKDDSVQKWLPVSKGPNATNQTEDHELYPDRSLDKRRDRPMRKRMDSPDVSPSDLSPPRRSKPVDVNYPSDLGESSSDLSPPRMKRYRDGDISPPRKKRMAQRGGKRRLQSPGICTNEDLHSSSAQNNRRFRKESWSDVDDHTLPKRDNESQFTSAGSLENGSKSVKGTQNISRSLSVSGNDAKTVYRDKDGRKVDLDQEKIREEQEKTLKDKENEKFLLWGRG